jgi:hypothetical protein
MRKWSPPSFSVLLSTPDCALLVDDATADFAGYPLSFAREQHDGGCDGLRASLGLSPGAFDGRDTVLTIRDSTETWTISLLAMHDGDVTLSKSTFAPGDIMYVAWSEHPGTVTVTPALGVARLDLATSTGTFDVDSAIAPGWLLDGGNDLSEVIVPARAPTGPATATIQLTGSYEQANMRCEGPASCENYLEVAATFAVTIQ